MKFKEWLLGKRNKNSEEIFKIQNDTDEELFPEPEKLEIHVTVTDQICQTKNVGIKQPKVIKEFFIFFKDDCGKTFKIPVPEDMYDGFEINQKGSLTLVNGELYGFALDE